MNKKGSLIGWIFAILGVVAIVGLIILLIVASNQEPKKVYNNETLDVYLSAKDSDLKKATTIDYKVFYNSTNELISEGVIERNSYTELENVSEENLTIYCGGQGYYHEVINKIFTEKEKADNLSKIECSVSKIGKLTIESDSILREGEQIILLNVTSESNTRDLSFCISWTPNIILVNTDYEQIDKPDRYEKTTDKCFNTHIDLKDNSTIIRIDIKANEINDDELNFYFFDNDYVYSDGEYKLLSELDGNLGSNKDTEFQIE